MNKEKIIKPKDMGRNISDRLLQVILRLDDITKGSRYVLYINIAILTMNVYIIFFVPSKNESEADILKAQHLELLQQSEHLSYVSNRLDSIVEILADSTEISETDSSFIN